MARMRNCDYRLRKKDIRLNDDDDDDVRSIYVMFDLQNYNNNYLFLPIPIPYFIYTFIVFTENGLTQSYIVHAP